MMEPKVNPERNIWSFHVFADDNILNTISMQIVAVIQ